MSRQTTTTAPPATTTVAGQTTAYTVTASDGYVWRITAKIPTTLTFSKRVADSPPGKAKMEVRATGNPTGTITGATPGGRNTPASEAVLMYANFTLPDNFKEPKVTSYSNVGLNTPLCEVFYGSVFRCRLDIFGFFAAMPGSLYQPTGQPSGMDLVADEYSETELDTLLGLLKNQQPTFTISGGSVLGGAADHCQVILHPDGSVEPDRYYSCKVTKV